MGENGQAWGSAVPEAAQPQPLPCFHSPPVQAESWQKQGMQRTWEALRVGRSCKTQVSRHFVGDIKLH